MREDAEGVLPAADQDRGGKPDVPVMPTDRDGERNDDDRPLRQRSEEPAPDARLRKEIDRLRIEKITGRDFHSSSPDNLK